MSRSFPRSPFPSVNTLKCRGHSLGSAILFDLLCRQRESPIARVRGKHSKNRPSNATKVQGKSLDFDFDVEDFYCLGSPIGLFQMLKGRTILGRHTGYVISRISRYHMSTIIEQVFKKNLKVTLPTIHLKPKLRTTNAVKQFCNCGYS